MDIGLLCDARALNPAAGVRRFEEGAFESGRAKLAGPMAAQERVGTIARFAPAAAIRRCRVGKDSVVLLARSF